MAVGNVGSEEAFGWSQPPPEVAEVGPGSACPLSAVDVASLFIFGGAKGMTQDKFKAFSKMTDATAKKAILHCLQETGHISAAELVEQGANSEEESANGA